MKHVALYLPSLRGGGAERVMVTLARGLADSGVRVDMVLARGEGPYVGELPSAVRLFDLRSSRVLTSLPGLVRYLRRERPDALLSTLDHANLVALWARRLAGVAVRIVVRVPINVGANTANSRDLRARAIFHLMRRFYASADAVVAVSTGVADDLVQAVGIPPEKVHVIYNPVVTPDLLSKSREPVDHPWFAPGQPPVVLAVGRLAAQKDYATLIHAFALVRKERQARLLILGEGEERESLESLAIDLGLEADVALPGFVDNPYAYMARAAVFVLSSRWEGLPNALIQALALSGSVVATDCQSGPREVLRGGEYGSLVRVGDIDGLARAILDRLRSDAVKIVPEAVRPFQSESVCSQYFNLLADHS